MEVNSFLQYLGFEKRCSAHTVIAYKTDLEQFSSYLSAEYKLSSVQEVNHIMLRSWVISLMEKGLDPRSVKRKITTLRSFFRFLLKTGTITADPTLKLLSPKLSKQLPVFMDEQKLNAHLDAIPAHTTFEEARDQLLLEMLYSTGMRLAEIIHIKCQDVDLHGCCVKVLGKRNKERIIPFSLQMKVLLETYLRYKASVTVPGRQVEDYLLVTGKGDKVYPKMVYRIVKHHLSQITTAEKKSPHVLRHTFATHMLDKGADINAIKEILGHSSLAATQVYTHNTIDKLKNIYKQAHPRA